MSRYSSKKEDLKFNNSRNEWCETVDGQNKLFPYYDRQGSNNFQRPTTMCKTFHLTDKFLLDYFCVDRKQHVAMEKKKRPLKKCLTNTTRMLNSEVNA